MSSLEKNILSFIKKHFILLVLVLATLLSLIQRVRMFPFESGDMQDFLVPWFNMLKDAGGLKGLGKGIGNYNIPYMTILALLTYLPISPVVSIKIVSVLFDYICAAAFALCISFFMKKDKLLYGGLFFLLVLFLPPVFINSSMWGQCDVIYTAFLFLSLYAFLKKKYWAGMILYSLSFCFKLQAIFLLPALLLFWFFSEKFSVLTFLCIPASMLVTALPALIAGRPLLDILNIYFAQTSTYQRLTLNYPNVFYWLTEEYGLYASHFILLTFAILLIGVLIFSINKNRIAADYIGFAAWSGLVCLYFLPSMHERYGYAVDLFLLLYVLIIRKHYWVSFSFILSSTAAYIFVLLGRQPYINFRFLSLLSLVALSYFTFVLFSGWMKPASAGSANSVSVADRSVQTEKE